MQNDPHRDIPALYFRSEIQSVEAVIFLFHGRGGGIESIHNQLGRHILRDNLVLVIPQADSNCWYPFRFNEPEAVNQPWLDSALAWIHNEVSQFVHRGLDPARIFFGGMSQGSCLALEYLLRYPQRYGGVFCLSGGLIGPEGERQPLADNALQGTPVFLGCADEDDWIPRVKFDESVAVLNRSGATVEARLYEGLGHKICEEELNLVRDMIDQVFAAARDAIQK